jgi:acetyltransferase-like isoleucine patch superfamily enzyme
MTSIVFKVYYLLFKVYLYVLSNIDDRLYMKNYIPFLKSIGVNIKGAPRFINYDVYLDKTDNSSLIELNDNCVISGNTLILTHDYSIFHASIGCNKISKNDPEFKRTGRVIIGENAFVGANSIILPNVVVGKNAIVGAGSVVTKDVPENTIVAGNPARKIEMIQEYVDKTCFLK